MRNSHSHIVVFGYKRPDHLQATLASIENNTGAAEYTVDVYIDGPSTADEAPLVSRTRSVVDAFESRLAMRKHYAESNRGLAESLITGISEALKHSPSAIVIEDDVMLAPNTLAYFRSALQRYQGSGSVASISAFSQPPWRLRIPRSYPYDAYFLTRNSSWGWATWADRWDKVDWDMIPWLKMRSERYAVRQLKRKGPDLPRMLDQQLDGTIDSWAVRFTLHHFLQGMVSLIPVYSYVQNIGHDGTGTHSGKTSRYNNDLSLAVDEPRLPPFVEIDPVIEKRFARLYKTSNLWSIAKRVKRVFRP